MSAPFAVLALLRASDGLAALIGSRIYPDTMPEPPVYSSVTFQKVGGAGVRGAVKNPGLMRAEIQVSTWARSRVEAARIATQVRKALDRKRKMVAGGVPVDDCFYGGDVDSEDQETGICINHMDFTIHYREPA